jgi:hypothetical protein
VDSAGSLGTLCLSRFSELLEISRRLIDSEDFAGGAGSMTGLWDMNWRRIALFAFLLPLLGIGCKQHWAKSEELVSLDLTRLNLHQNDASLPAQISLVPIKSVRLIPESVRSRIPKMSNPGGRFQAGDVEFIPGTPTRRLVFGGISDRYCLVHYEYGGWGHGYKTALFALSGGQSVPLWVHAGSRYASLNQFVKETDPDELTNEVKDAVF